MNFIRIFFVELTVNAFFDGKWAVPRRQTGLSLNEKYS